MLNGHHPPRGERAAVADPVHLVEDGNGGISRPQEVSMEGVRSTDVDGAAGGHQRLCGNLTAEHPLAVLVGADPAEDIDLDRLEIE